MQTPGYLWSFELDGGDGLFTGNYRGEPYAYETVPEEEEEEELLAA